MDKNPEDREAEKLLQKCYNAGKNRDDDDNDSLKKAQHNNDIDNIVEAHMADYQHHLNAEMVDDVKGVVVEASKAFLDTLSDDLRTGKYRAAQLNARMRNDMKYFTTQYLVLC